ncbi:major facilitator superfamily general substrate [Fusarium longipes]|uniref:Major facilitator superfamily general substrate n=1 Tax=Fusarium longipes TaxID=694270 RepID=A0A395T322_9HYPO|nr:major facilitator superfamily general substrate [Fusarium longipes]
MSSHQFTIPLSYLLPFLSICLFTIQLGLVISDLPSIKLMQNIVCKHVHQIDSPTLLPEESCRDEPVQFRLNFIITGMQIAGTVAASVVALPLGLLADRIGRLPVLGASISSILLAQSYAMFVCWQADNIPLEAIWGIGVPLLFGGGRSVAEAMVFAIIADIVPDDKRQVMVVLGILISIGGVVLVVLTPETLRQAQPRDDDTTAIDPYTFTLELDNSNFELPEKVSALATVKSIFSRPLIWLLPGAVMTIPLATTQTEIIIRLIPIRFDWPLERSILIVSLQSLVTLLTLCILLPAIMYTWAKFSRVSSAHFRYSVLARSSSLLFLAGCLCMMILADKFFVIVGLAIAALGSGLPTLCRAMLVGMVDQGRAGTLFGVLAVGEILGFLVFETSMGALFGLGLKTWIAWLVPVRLLRADDDAQHEA